MKNVTAAPALSSKVGTSGVSRCGTVTQSLETVRDPKDVQLKGRSRKNRLKSAVEKSLKKRSKKPSTRQYSKDDDDQVTQNTMQEHTCNPRGYDIVEPTPFQTIGLFPTQESINLSRNARLGSPHVPPEVSSMNYWMVDNRNQVLPKHFYPHEMQHQQQHLWQQQQWQHQQQQQWQYQQHQQSQHQQQQDD